MHLALVFQRCVYYKNIIHKLLTSHFSKLERGELCLSRKNEESWRNNCRLEASTTVKGYSFASFRFYSLQYRITDWCLFEITCDFQLFSSFRRGQREMYYSKHEIAAERRIIIAGRNGVWIFTLALQHYENCPNQIALQGTFGDYVAFKGT